MIRSPLIDEKLQPVDNPDLLKNFEASKDRVADFRNWIILQGFGKLFTDRADKPAMRYFINPPLPVPPQDTKVRTSEPTPPAQKVD